MRIIEPRTKLGGFIRERRLILGLTQKQLANKVRLSLPCIAKYEYGRIRGSAMSSILVRRFTKALQCPSENISELLPQKVKVWRLSVEPPPTELGILVFSRRQELRLTQDELGQRMGTQSNSTYNFIETGKSKTISLDMGERLAKALEMDFSLLEPFTKEKLLAYSAYRKRQSESALGRFIRSKRIELNMSQEKLAIKLGVTRAYISEMEIGKANLSQSSRLSEIAEILGVDIRVIEALRGKRKIHKVHRGSEGFGASLTQKRLQMGISQKELAKKANTYSSYLSSIERGLWMPKPNMLQKVSDALNC